MALLINQKSLVYIEKNEEITSVIDKIRRQKNREIFLIIPKGAIILQGLLNLQLLRRQSEVLNKKIILITKDKIGKEIAKRIGIEVKKDIEAKMIQKMQIQEEKMEKKEKMTDQTKKQIAVLDIVKRGPINLGLRKKNKIIKKKPIISLQENKKDNAASSAMIHESPHMDILKKSAQNIKEESAKEKNKKFALMEANKRPFSYQKMQKLFNKNKNKLEKLKKIQSLVKRSKQKKESFDKSKTPSWVKYLLYGFSVLVFSIVVLSLFFFLPKAEIKITLVQRSIRENLEVIIAEENLENETLLPFLQGELKQETKKETRIFKATGKNTFSDKAQGEVILKNFNTIDQVLVEKTRLLNPEGLMFRMKEAVVVPRSKKNQQGETEPGVVTVKVEADKVGEEGCITTVPTEFRIAAFLEKNDPRAKTIIGESQQSFQGGKAGEQNVVSENDLEEAKKIIEQILKQSFAQEIKNYFSQNIDALENAIKVKNIEFSADKNIGEVAENFSLEAQGEVFFMLFDENKLFDISSAFLSDKIDPDERLIQDMKEGIRYEIKNFNEEKKEVILGIVLNNEIEKNVDLEKISNAIKGKKPEEAKEIILSDEKIESVEFVLSPFWVNKISKFTNRIYIYKN